MKSPLLLALLAAPAAAQALHYELDAPAGVRQYGHAVAPVGDLDGDGLPDFALSALSMRVELRSGADGALLALREDTTFGYGGVLAGAGDVDGDGLPDLAVGSPGPYGAVIGCYEGCPYPTPGSVEILSGRDASLVLHLGEQDGWDDEFGAALAPLGDVDHDDHADFAVGAPANQYHAVDAQEAPHGKVFAFSGATGALLWTVQGLAPRAGFGVALAALPDLDGDGLGEVAVGASSAFAPLGTVVPPPELDLFSGATGALLRRFVQPTWPGVALPISNFGATLAVVPQAAGLPRLLVGYAPPFGTAFGGSSGVVLFDLAQDRVLAWPEFLGPWQAGQGATVAAGDVTGDGQPELLIGHEQRSELLLCAGDASWLNSLGRCDTPGFPNVLATGHIAAAGAVLGDVTGDGVPDILMGESGSGGDQWSYGRVRVFRGGAGPWTDLGAASPDDRSAPLLFPSLTRTPQTSWSPDSRLVLRVGAPYVTGFATTGRVVIGLDAAWLPVPGGVLVPAPQLSLPFALPYYLPYAQVLDLDVPPDLPSGLTFYVQAVVANPGVVPVYSDAWRGELP